MKYRRNDDVKKKEPGKSVEEQGWKNKRSQWEGVWKIMKKEINKRKKLQGKESY